MFYMFYVIMVFCVDNLDGILVISVFKWSFWD